ALAAACTLHCFRDGEAVCTEGDPAPCAMIVARGSLALFGSAQDSGTRGATPSPTPGAGASSRLPGAAGRGMVVNGEWFAAEMLLCETAPVAATALVCEPPLPPPPPPQAVSRS